MNRKDFVSLFADSTNGEKSSSGQYTKEDLISMFADSVEQNSDSKTQESPTEPQTTQSMTTGGQNQQNTSKKDRDLLAYQYDSLVGLGVVPSAEQTAAKQMQESEQNSMQLAAQTERQNYSDEELFAAYAKPDVKLSDYQIDTAKELVKGFEAKYPKAQSFDPVNGTDQESAYQYAAMMNDPQYQEYLQLKNKVDGFSAFTTGLTEGTGIPELIHFAGFSLGDDEDKAAMDAWRDDRNTVSAAGSVQNPIASGAGYLGGKMAEYAAGRDLLKAIPGVGNALQRFGGTVNTALNSGTKAGTVLSTLFPADRIAGIASDQILDLLLDTTPQVAEDIMRMNRQQREGVAEGEERLTPFVIGGRALGNFSTNLGYNLLGEIPGMIGDARKNLPDALKAQDALDALDEGITPTAQQVEAYNRYAARNGLEGSEDWYDVNMSQRRNLFSAQEPEEVISSKMEIPGQSTRNNPNQIDGTLKTEYNGTNGGVLNESAGAAGVRGVAGDTLPLSERDGITDAIGGQTAGGNQVLRGFLTPDENLNQAVARTGATPLELTDTTGDPQLFSSALEQARQANPHGLMVSGKSVEELTQPGTVTFMSRDGLAGALVTADGDIEAVFKNPQSSAKGAASSLLLNAINNGGAKLDCYGDDLVKLYNRHGFEPVARVEWNPEYAPEGWTYGPKDVYVMKLADGLGIDEITARLDLREADGGFHLWTQEELNALPVMDYDEALAYRDSLIKSDAASSSGATGPDLVGSGKDTIINDSPAGHTPEQMRVIEEYKNAVDPRVVSYADRVLENPTGKYRDLSLGKVQDAEAARIQELTGVDVTDYEHNLRAERVVHISKRHGAQGIADRSMSNAEDLGRIEWVMHNADNIELGNDVKWSTQFKNRDNSVAKSIVYEKAIDGTYYVVEAVPDSKAKKLEIITAYISENKKGTDVNTSMPLGTRQVPDILSPQLTPETILPSAPENSISDPLQNINPDMPAPSIGAMESNPARYSNMQNTYGTIAPGENPSRVVDVPVSTNGSDRVSRFARTAMEAEATPDSMLKNYESYVEQGLFSYKPKKDKAALNTAVRNITQNGYQGARDQWQKVVDGFESVTKENMVLAQLLYAEAAKAGDTDTAMKLAAEIAAEGTNLGQSIQAMRLLKKMTPEGQLYYAQRVVDKLNRDILAGKNTGIGISGTARRAIQSGQAALEIPKELADQLLGAKTAKEISSASEAIFTSIAQQLPADWATKWNAWRYLSMLGNPRTHIRNIIGNAVFYPARKIKDMIGAGLESAMIKDTAGRTKAILNPFDDADNARKAFAKADYDNEMKAVLTGGGKQNPENIIKQNQKVFTSKLTQPVEFLRKFNSDLMDAEDSIFLKNAYADSMAGYMKAQGLTAEDMTGAVLEKARSYAIEQAQKATYRDASALASALNRFTQTNTANRIIGGSLFPFTKTPINIMKRGLEYSPVGIAKGIGEAILSVKNGSKTVAQAIDSISSGLTGTGLIALGAYLGYNDILTASGPDNKKEATFDDLTGQQEYSVKVGDGSYTLDWAAPTSLEIFVGAEIGKMFKEKNGLGFLQILDALSGISDPMINMTMLQGINNTIKAAGYGENALGELAVNAATGYVSQAVPTVFGQVARAVDDTRRTTYTESGQPLSGISKSLQKAENKIPGLSMLNQPYVDPWGRAEENVGGNFLGRLAYNMQSPGYYESNNMTQVDSILNELYQETGESSVLPGYASKTWTQNGEKHSFTADEYTQYSMERGQTAYSILEELTPMFEQLEPQQAVYATEKVYDIANQLAKQEVVGVPLDNAYQSIVDAAEDYDGGIAELLFAKAVMYDVEGEKDRNGDTISGSVKRNKIQALVDAGYSRSEAEKIYNVIG